MNKTTEEALRMAIEALLYGTNHTEAVNACKAALQENALDRMEENARDLGLEWECEQEPVAWIVKEHLENPISAVVRTKRPANDCIVPLYLHQDGNYIDDEKILDIASNHDCWQGSDTIEFVRDILKHTHPAQPLSDDEIAKIGLENNMHKDGDFFEFARAIEDKLLELNNGNNT